jgi:hypothetical protein
MTLCRGLNAGSGSVGLLSLVFTSVARTSPLELTFADRDRS